MNWTIFQVFVLIELSLSLAPSEIVILIMSQPDTYHINLAENLRADIYNQSLLINKDHLVNVHLLHETFNHPGDWTFLAVLPSFTTHNIIKPLTKWIILCEDRSTVNLENLIDELVKEDHSKDLYLGYPLYDREATIIHHFAFFENPQWFHYPLIRAGVAFTVPLIKRLTELVKVEKQATEFFIDASHELSLFIWQNMKIENNKVVQTQKDTIALPLNEVNPNIPKQQRTTTENSRLREQNRRRSIVDGGQNGSKLSREKEHKLLMVKAPYLCPSKGYGCAIYPNEATLTCDPISAETIFFAIKTCHKFHKDRIPTIEMTWGRYAVHKRFFSDFEDERIPTVSTGVPNTETGHCGKTLSIFKLAIQEVEDMNLRLEKPIQWIFLSDDDTLLSVSAVSDILGCFNADHTIYLGERYGYRLHSGDGFNYITGGGGIAFSLPAARKIVRSCTCPTISSPDDMILGSCLQRLGVRAIHSPRFHQARPPDYSPKLLALEKPVSFHKFWQIDPLQVYNQWFKSSDDALKLKSKINCDINTSRCTKIRRNLKNGKKYGDKVPIHNTRPPHVDL